MKTSPQDRCQEVKPDPGVNPDLAEAQVASELPRAYVSTTGGPSTHECVAVIVTHGMGQQVPFETIEGVAKSIWRGGGQAARDPKVRYVRLGTTGDDEKDQQRARVEMEVTGKDERVHDVHVYECYWAPLTEGKVTITDVISFLFVSGWQGFSNAVHGWLTRWMFKKEVEFELNRFWLVTTLLLTILLLLSLIIINTVLVAAAASHALGSSGSFPAGLELRTALTSDLLLADVSAVLVFLGTVLLPWLWRKASGKKVVPGLVGCVGWFLVGFGALGILLAGLFMPIQLNGYKANWFLWGWTWTFSPAKWLVSSHGFWLSALWGFAILAAACVRWILVEYPGDVVAYIQASSVSKFWEVRAQIWKVAIAVARAVYRARTVNGKAFLYDKVIMVGHSLGTVIAYDVLNGLLLEDGFVAPENSARVGDRTRMFLTFGSPLDKTAFLFRSQADMISPVREVAAAAVQPMIQDYAHRPKEWVNLWSRNDIVSGSLDYYDDCLDQSTGGGKRVKNCIDPSARTPLAAHVEYWNGDLLAQELYRAITT